MLPARSIKTRREKKIRNLADIKTRVEKYASCQEQNEIS